MKRVPRPGRIAGAILAVLSLARLAALPESVEPPARLSATLSGRLKEFGLTALPTDTAGRLETRWLELQADLRRKAELPYAEAGDLAAYGALLVFNGLADDAVSVLESVRGLDPASASAANDLAVAYLTRFRGRGDPLDLFRALEETHRSLGLGESSEADDNRAALLGMVGLGAPDPDVPDWTEWEKDLRRAASEGRLPELRAMTLQFPGKAREWAEFELLGEVPQASGAEAGVLLDAASAIGETLAERHGERLLLQTARSLRNELASGKGLGIQGLTHFQTGLGKYRLGEYSTVGPEMERASELLREAGNPFRLWSDFYRALAFYQEKAYPNAEDLLRRVEGEAVPAGYRALAARSAFVQGLIFGLQGRIPAYALRVRQALDGLEGTGEFALQAAFQNELATLLSYRGDSDGALRSLARVLALERYLDDPGRRSTFHSNIGLLLAELGLRRAASEFFEKAVGEARETKGVSSVVQTLRLRAASSLSLGKSEAAAADLREALKLCDAIPEVSSRETARADTLLASGRTRLEGDPSGAESDLREAIKLFARGGISIRLPEARLALSRSLLRLRRTAEARQALREGIGEVETMRGRMKAPEERARFLDARLGLYDEWIELELAEGRSDDALRALEESRARSLKESLGVEPSTVEPGRDLGPEEAVLQYFLSRSGVVTWVITRDSTIMERFPLEDPRILPGLIQRLSTESDSTAAERLYEILIAPVVPRLTGKTRLAMVPDKQLWSLPFGALRDPETKRFLVESFAVGIAPSPSAYRGLAESARTRAASALAKALLAAYGAAGDGVLPLPYALEEVREVGEIYSGSRVLSGDQASLDAVSRLGADADVVHLAAHALDDPWRPWNSRLRLAPDAASQHDGLVMAEDLERLAGRWGGRVRLVVLAACSTGVASPSPSEGMGGLIQPFLSHGVPAVVASLRRIDDQVSRDLMTRFHRHYRDTGDAFEALRRAQLELLKSDPGTAPEAFAFQAYGAVPGSGR